MKKPMFYYLGTEEQLIESGFIKNLNDSSIYMRRGKADVFVFLDEDIYGNRLFVSSKYSYDKMKKRYIKDLIKKGIVETLVWHKHTFKKI